MQVCFNSAKDRNYALNKINWLQQNTTGIEFVAIIIPYGIIPSNPNPQIPTTHATIEQTRPTRAPYICHWDANNYENWYKMDWNQHITLRCGLMIDFNIVLTELYY